MCHTKTNSQHNDAFQFEFHFFHLLSVYNCDIRHPLANKRQITKTSQLGFLAVMKKNQLLRPERNIFFLVHIWSAWVCVWFGWTELGFEGRVMNAVLWMKEWRSLTGVICSSEERMVCAQNDKRPCELSIIWNKPIRKQLGRLLLTSYFWGGGTKNNVFFSLLMLPQMM